MKLSRRALLLSAPAVAWGQADDDAVRASRALRFPRDHGAHLGARIEWWYVTGWFDMPSGAALGFQITFFRSRTGLAPTLPGRFAPRQLLFAHAALSDIAAQRHQQAQRVARWSGDASTADARAFAHDTNVSIGRWQLQRDEVAGASRYSARAGDVEAGFQLNLVLTATQPLLLQGEQGFSRKGPLPVQASHYYSLPHLRAQGEVVRAGKSATLAGSAWLDHEWSDQLLPEGAVGWDWIGINLADGGALMAFRLRRADGSALWAGGSHRAPDGRLAVFAAHDVSFTPLRHWASPASLARYPVLWQISVPGGRYRVRAMMDAQELDGRASNGAVYWEGLAELLDEQARVLGRGYLEMTGYAKPLRMQS